MVAFAMVPGFAYAQQSGNWLYIEFGAVQQVRLAANGTEVKRPFKLLQRSKCELDTATPLADLVVFSSTSSPVGWRSEDGRIGVNGTSKGAPCTEIRDGQSIELELGSLLDGQSVKNAYFNFVVGKAADIQITAYNGSIPVHDELVSCATGTCRVELLRANADTAGTASPDTWTRIVLTTATKPTGEAGAWSLGTSSFELLPFVPEGDLACNQSTDEVDLVADPDEPPVYRLADAVPVGGCNSVPFTLSVTRFPDSQELNFLVDYSFLDEGEIPAFRIEMTWDPEIVQLPAGYQPVLAGTTSTTILQRVPLTSQRFLASDPAYLLDLCPGTPSYDGFGDLIAVDLLAYDEPAASPLPGGRVNVNDMSTYPGFQYGCLADRRVEILNYYDDALNPARPDGSPTEDSCQVDAEEQPANAVCVRVTELIYVQGDITFRRTYQ